MLLLEKRLASSSRYHAVTLYRHGLSVLVLIARKEPTGVLQSGKPWRRSGIRFGSVVAGLVTDLDVWLSNLKLGICGLLPLLNR